DVVRMSCGWCADAGGMQLAVHDTTGTTPPARHDWWLSEECFASSGGRPATRLPNVQSEGIAMPTTRKSAKRTANKPAVGKTSASARKTTRKAATRKPSTSRTSTQGRGDPRQSARGSAAARRAAGPSTKAGSSTAKRANRSTRGKAPNAIELLTKDHGEVKKMFRKAERMDADDPALRALVEKACAALTLHAELEEQLFYPPLREKDPDAIAEAAVEHDVAKDLIAQLRSMSAGDERYQATFKVLGEYVGHHIEEEEGEIFRLAKRAKLDLAAIGAEIKTRKEGAARVDGSADGDRAAASRDAARKAARGPGPAHRAPAGREASAADDNSSGHESDPMPERTYGRTHGDVAEDTEQPGRSGRFAGAVEDDPADTEVDVETPRDAARRNAH
ncbi:MAG: hemerythrin domain-containing protein, partial [Casimicrobiaceae bacterium]